MEHGVVIAERSFDTCPRTLSKPTISGRPGELCFSRAPCHCQINEANRCFMYEGTPNVKPVCEALVFTCPPEL